MKRLAARIAPWLLLLPMAYVLGRWQGARHAPSAEARGTGEASPRLTSTTPPTTDRIESTEPESTTRAAELSRTLADLHAAARTMATPDARTYAFFEGLQRDDLPGVASQIRSMPAGNEQDLFFAMVIRRWAELDGPAALEEARLFPALGTRLNAEQGAWEAWGARDPRAAFSRAILAGAGLARDRALAAILGGAGTRDPREALGLWQEAPEDFRTAMLGPPTLDQIVAAACGTGKRDEVKALVAGLPPGATRDRLAAALCAEWGGHYPDEALLWLNETLPDGEARTAGMARIFESLVQKDPALAATWGAGFPDPRRRSGMIASAISTWVEINPTEAELWINEQSDSAELDGATFAMAAHYIGSKDMPKAFSWIRRIRRDDARTEFLGNLGRAWSRERPAEFRQFLEQNSLNRAELDALLSQATPSS